MSRGAPILIRFLYRQSIRAIQRFQRLALRRFCRVCRVGIVLFDLAGLTKTVVEIEQGWIQTPYTLPITIGVTVELYEESEQGVQHIYNQYFEFLLSDEMGFS